MKIKNLRLFLENAPYKKDFEQVCIKSVRNRIDITNSFFKWISGNKVNKFLELYLSKLVLEESL